jgi:hypothetical protein
VRNSTFGYGSVTEIASGDPVPVLHGIGERKSYRQRQPAADNRVAAVEPLRGVEEVHGPAPAARTALLLAEHLSHDRGHRHAAQQCVCMLAIGGDDGVVRLQRTERAGRHRLLADVQVEESSNLGLAVQLCAFFFHAADADHVRQQPPGEVFIVHVVT